MVHLLNYKVDDTILFGDVRFVSSAIKTVRQIIYLLKYRSFSYSNVITLTVVHNIMADEVYVLTTHIFFFF